jgi:hypothetical protein
VYKPGKEGFAGDCEKVFSEERGGKDEEKDEKEEEDAKEEEEDEEEEEEDKGDEEEKEEEEEGVELFITEGLSEKERMFPKCGDCC